MRNDVLISAGLAAALGAAGGFVARDPGVSVVTETKTVEVPAPMPRYYVEKESVVLELTDAESKGMRQRAENFAGDELKRVQGFKCNFGEKTTCKMYGLKGATATHELEAAKEQPAFAQWVKKVFAGKVTTMYAFRCTFSPESGDKCKAFGAVPIAADQLTPGSRLLGRVAG